MLSFQTRLFLRIIAKSREAYFLKIITLAIAFACATLILLFSISEFGYDKFHRKYDLVFRVLQRNNSESYIGNRFSNKIPFDVFNVLKSINSDSLITSRVKLLDKVDVLAGDQLFNDCKIYAADPDISNIFSFGIKHGVDFRRIHSWVTRFQGKPVRRIKPKNKPDADLPKEELPTDVKQLQEELRKAKLHNKLLNAIIDIAEEQLKIDIRKKSG
jgi:hypothetical protein